MSPFYPRLEHLALLQLQIRGGCFQHGQADGGPSFRARTFPNRPACSSSAPRRSYIPCKN
eukprot:1140132-Pelagomonas_calceolata.AAC.2